MDERLITIADHYGKNIQTLKAIEEMAELTKALLKGDEPNIAEEIADVSIMLDQLIYLMYGNGSVIGMLRNHKIERQLGRMRNE